MKTAEEILREVYSPSEPYGSAVVAMEDFAAQEVAKEVEAYKERLKQKLEYSFIERSYREGIEKIIDETK